MALALAQAPLEAPPSGDAAFVDLAGLTVVSWPVGWSLPLALLALFGMTPALVRLARRGSGEGRRLLAAFPAWLFLVAAPMVLVWLLVWVARARHGGLALEHATVPDLRFCSWVLVLCTSTLLARTLVRCLGEAGILVGVSLGFSGLAVVAACLLPASSIVFILPALGGMVGLLVAAWAAPGSWTAGLGLSLPGWAALLLFPKYALALQHAFGFGPLSALPVVFLGAALAPVLGVLGAGWVRGGLLAVLGCIGLVRFGSLLAGISCTEESPCTVWRLYLEEAEEGRASLNVAHEGGGHESEPGKVMPLAPQGLGVPQLVESTLTRTEWGCAGELLLRSARGAGRLTVSTPDPARVRALHVEGRSGLDAARGRWHFLGYPEDGLRLGLDLLETEPLELRLTDEVPGLPPEVMGWVEERRGYVPRDGGDRSRVTTHVRVACGLDRGGEGG